jgi:hypothetical protein
MGWDVEDWNDSMIPLHVWRFFERDIQTGFNIVFTYFNYVLNRV